MSTFKSLGKFCRTLRWLPLVAALCWLPGAMADVAETDVHVERAGDNFTVDLVLHTPVSPTRAWAVLTDFEHMADFVPNVTSSQVSERSETLVKVTQKGVVRFGVFSSRFESIRDVHLTPLREIRAIGVGGNIQNAITVMQLEPEGVGTKLTYHAEASPGFWFPPLVGPSLVQHETADQFNAMLREMLKRAEGSQP